MAITLHPDDLKRILEAAARLARDTSHQPTATERLWIERLEVAWEWRQASQAVAAIGAALLALSTNELIDPLSLKQASGRHGYSARGVAKFLAANRAAYGFELGSDADDPLAASPFNDFKRIDLVDKWRNAEAGAELRAWLTDLSHGEATEALVAFLKVGMRRAAVLSEQRAAARSHATATSIEHLVQAATMLAATDAEDGRIGAAAVAAAYTAAGFRVEARIVNDPGQTDVDVYDSKGRSILIGIEVKQKRGTPQDARAIARGAADVDATKAALVLLHPQQQRLDVDGLRRAADTETGVALDIQFGFRDCFAQAIYASAGTRADFVSTYPRCLDRWLVNLAASEAARDRWELMSRAWDDDIAPNL